MINYWLWSRNTRATVLLVAAFFTLLLPSALQAEEGVTDNEIRIGTVLSLEGRSRELGGKTLRGMEAAFQGQVIGGKKLTLLSRNDSNNPARTAAAVKELVDEGVLLLIGKVGNPTSKAALTTLRENKVPSLIFLSGTDLHTEDEASLQTVNFRASYKLETASVINNALRSGVKPAEVCAYVQNDSYGVSGVLGMRKALQGHDGAETTLLALAEVLVDTTPNKPVLNNLGPVGTYTRNTFRAREGYESLKFWEKQSGTACRLVITVGSYDSIAHFIAYAKSKGENWVYSAVSSTGAANLLTTLKRFDATDRVLMTQVVPALDSELSIVADAREALGDDFGYVTMNGYISARLLISGLKQLVLRDKAITRENLMREFKGVSFQLWGLHLDFRKDEEKFDFITTTHIVDDEWIQADDAIWQGWYK